MSLHVVSSYGGPLSYFGDSLRAIILHSCAELGIDVEFNLYDDGYTEVDSDIVLFVMPPERVPRVIKSLNIPDKARKILWNLEPLCEHDAYMHPKYVSRHISMLNILDDGYIDELWAYNDSQMSLYEDKIQCKYVPIGISPTMISDEEVTKLSITRKHILFLGVGLGFRRRFFKQLSWLYKKIHKKKKARPPRLRIHRQTHHKYRGLTVALRKVASYRIGLDIRAGDSAPEYIRWHRLMMYAAAKLVIFSDSDLSKYGFKHGVHYLHYSDVENLAILLGKIIGSDKKQQALTENMLDKVLKEFSMTDILEKALYM